MCYSLTGHEQTTIQNFKKEHRHVCYYCGKEIIFSKDLTVDHLIPVSRGGKTVEENLAICCYQCNQEKANMTEEEYKLYLNKKDELINNIQITYNTKQLINTYQAIIDTYENIYKEIGEQNEMKVQLENTIESETCNASDGYNLYRDLRDTLRKTTDLRREKQKMTPLYEHVKKEIQSIENISKNMLSYSVKELRNEFINNKNIA